MQSEDEVADKFLMAAVYVRAIRTDQTPQEIVEALFKSVPDSETWPAFREALLVALEEAEGPD